MAEESHKVKKRPATMSEKEAYFEQLDLWVKHANLSHFAMTTFPYYLMANPQLLSIGDFPINTSNQPQQQPQQPQLLQPPQHILQRLNMLNRNRFRQDNVFDQMRNDESKSLLLLFDVCF